MIQVWVDAAGIVPGGRPIKVKASAGTYATDLVEIYDERGALVATVKYSHVRPPDRRSKVWIEVKSGVQVWLHGRSEDMLPLPNDEARESVPEKQQDEGW